MALARIITRSHQYAQQLALDLLARGYQVEVVSPDAIPTVPADLELRVEAYGTEAHAQITEVREKGKPAKSIEYLQRLKPMMADLLRRWPANAAAKPGPENNVVFNSEAESSDDVELPSNQHPQGPESTELTSPVHMTSEEAEFTESARLISPASTDGQQKRPAAAPSIFSITGEPISWADSEPKRTGRSEVWFWRAAVGFACMALLILGLGMALRKSPPAPTQAAVPAGTQTVAATTQPAPATPAAKLSAASPAPLPTKAVVVAAAVRVPAVAKAKPSAAVRRTRAGQNNEGMIGDTTVTYFNTKAAEQPKSAANQASGIKHYSDMD
jgi:hypothetical protein